MTVYRRRGSVVAGWTMIALCFSFGLSTGLGLWAFPIPARILLTGFSLALAGVTYPLTIRPRLEVGESGVRIVNFVSERFLSWHQMRMFVGLPDAFFVRLRDGSSLKVMALAAGPGAMLGSKETFPERLADTLNDRLAKDPSHAGEVISQPPLEPGDRRRLRRSALLTIAIVIAVSIFQVSRIGPSEAVSEVRLEAQKLFDVGLSSQNQGRYGEAIAAYDEILRLHRDSGDRVVINIVAAAMAERVEALRHSDLLEESLAAAEEAIARLEGSDSPVHLIALIVTKAEAGLALNELGRGSEALVSLDEVIEEFGETTEAYLIEPMAEIFFAKGQVQAAMGQFEEAITAFDQVVSRLSGSKTAHGFQQVAIALLSKARTLERGLGRSDEAIAVADELILESEDPFASDEIVALAMEVRIDALTEQRRFQEAILASDELLSRFGLENSETIDFAIARALVLKGFGHEQLGRRDLAVEAYEEVLARYGGSTNSQLHSSVSYAEERLVIFD